MKITEFDLKWVCMARYELILRLDGALWLTIISETPLTPKHAMEGLNPKMAPRRGAIHNLGVIFLKIQRPPYPYLGG